MNILTVIMVASITNLHILGLNVPPPPRHYCRYACMYLEGDHWYVDHIRMNCRNSRNVRIVINAGSSIKGPIIITDKDGVAILEVPKGGIIEQRFPAPLRFP